MMTTSVRSLEPILAQRVDEYESLGAYMKRTWRHPWHDWTEEEIHAHAMREVGSDDLDPRGFYVLVKLWNPPERDKNGILLPDHVRYKDMITSTVGKVIRMGNDAFRDEGRFPSGPLITIGEWGVFRNLDRQMVATNGTRMAFMHDDRFVCVTRKPQALQSTFDLEYEHRGS